MQLRKPVITDDDNLNDDSGSGGGGSGGGGYGGAGSASAVAGGGGSVGSSIALKSTDSLNGLSVTATGIPHLLIKPASALTLNAGVLASAAAKTEAAAASSSPPKNTFIDRKGKLQGKDLGVPQNNFEVLHQIDRMKATGDSSLTLSQQPVVGCVPLVPIKHPYLTMNGTKHVLPDKVVASMVNARKNNSSVGGGVSGGSSSVYDPQASRVDSVFLGNTSSVHILDSGIGHTTDNIAHNIPWLPRGTLEPMEHNRSNPLLGKKEHHDLQRYCPVDATKQVLTIRSQRAIREAFEEYVSQRLLQQQHMVANSQR